MTRCVCLRARTSANFLRGKLLDPAGARRPKCARHCPRQTQARRPQRKAAKDARALISDQYSLSVGPDSPREKRIRGRAARDVSPSIASDVDYLSHGSISEDFSGAEDEASLDPDELWSVEFNQEYVHCSEDNDSEIEEDDAPDQPDIHLLARGDRLGRI